MANIAPTPVPVTPEAAAAAAAASPIFLESSLADRTTYLWRKVHAVGADAEV